MIDCARRDLLTRFPRNLIPSSAAWSDPQGSARGRIGTCGRRPKCHTRPAPTLAAWTERASSATRDRTRPNSEAHRRAESQVDRHAAEAFAAANAPRSLEGRTPYRVRASLSFAVRLFRMKRTSRPSRGFVEVNLIPDSPCEGVVGALSSWRGVGQLQHSSPNQALHLTGAAMLVSRGSTSVGAAPAGELGRSALSDDANVATLARLC